MNARTVEQLMTRDVVAARPTWSFKTAARHLRSADVSALPVVDDDGLVLGIVSEADLLLKDPDGVRGRRISRRRRRREREKASARTVEGLMTSPAITIGPDATLTAAARLMHDRLVKRLPVVDERGRLLGILSRGDLISIFLRPDERIREDIVHDVIEHGMWLDPRQLRVAVTDGVVSLEGDVETKSLAQILVGMTRGVEGVVDVVSRLTYRTDDSHLRPEIPLPWGVLPPSMQVPRRRRPAG